MIYQAILGHWNADILTVLKNELFKFKNLKVLEITGHLRGDGLDGKAIVCPKLEIIRLLKIHHIGPFRELLTCESKRLHLTVIHNISKTEISWILQNKPPLNRNRVFTHEIRYMANRRSFARPVARQPEMAAKKTGKAAEKSKFYYLGKSKIRSIASVITSLFLGTLKAANLAKIPKQKAVTKFQKC